MPRRALFLLALSIASAAAVTAQQVTITLPDGRELTVAGSFSPDDLARKVRELESIGPSPQERPSDPLSNSAQRTGTSRISGRIVNSNGAALRQATVRAMATGFSKTVTTDLNGRYEFRDLPRGRYSVLAERLNYLTLAYGQLQPSDLYGRVELGDNQAADGIDIALPRGGVISGRVLDELGEPIPDLPVLPVRRSPSQAQSRPAPAGRGGVTNDIGEYRIVGLPPGQYYVSVSPRAPVGSDTGADVRDGYAPTYYPGTPMFASAGSITVGMNETIAGMDVSLASVRLATISGFAVDGQGAPARSGNVNATDRTGRLPSVSRTAPIGPDGSFTLAPLPPGDYLVSAVLPPRPPPPLPSDTPMPVPPAVLRSAIMALPPAETVVASVTLNGSDVTGVVLTPLKRVNVSGRVVFDSPGARPSPQALRLSITLRGPESGILFTAPPTVNDDFTFQSSLPAVELAMSVTSGGWVVKAIRMNGVDITDTGVDLRDNQDVSVEVVLTNNPPEVSGRAIDARGEAINDYGVLVFPQDRDRRVLDSRLVVAVRSDATGRYRVRTLPPGNYFAVLINPQQVARYSDLDLEALVARATPLLLGDNEIKAVDLRLPVGR